MVYRSSVECNDGLFSRMQNAAERMIGIGMKRMMHMESDDKEPKHPRFMGRFRRDEDGSMIVFTLFLLIMMLIVAGMSVDFMRYEAKRVELQGVADNAVLAAANLRLDSSLDPADVVTDYFEKAGMAEYMDGPPSIIPGNNSRSVSVSASVEMNTFFLRLVGMDTLDAPAVSTAIEGVGEVEVSLVLDISGSMRDNNRLVNLKKAATNFVNIVLADEFKDKISLSLVPYSQQVNAGPLLFDQMNMNQVHSWSYCIDFPDSDFGTTRLNTLTLYQQFPHFQTNTAYNTSTLRRDSNLNTIDEPICPRFSYEQITPFSNNRTALAAQIDKFQPRAGTSIFLGLKWGAALLDEDNRGLITPLIASGDVPSVFAGRPLAAGDPDDPSAPKKFIILMTDGQNQKTRVPLQSVYDEPSEIAHWGKYNFSYWYRRSGASYYDFVDRNYKYDEITGDRLMNTMCNAAKAKGIIIYSIAFEATSAGETAMQRCATNVDGYYFNTSGAEIVAIFEAIAQQITDLRLTQ